MKQLLSKLGLFAIISLMAVSCTFKEEITFNADYSGNMKYSFEMGGGGMPGMGKDDKKDSDTKVDSVLFAKMEKKVTTVTGVSNVESGSSGLAYYLKFDFNSIESLNKAYEEIYLSFSTDSNGVINPEHEKLVRGHQFVTKTKKGIVYEQSKVGLANDKMKGMEDVPETMRSMLNYEVLIHFPTKIKKVKLKNVDELNENTLRVKRDIKDLIDGKGFPKFEVKLKKK